MKRTIKSEKEFEQLEDGIYPPNASQKEIELFERLGIVTEMYEYCDKEYEFELNKNCLEDDEYLIKDGIGCNFSFCELMFKPLK